MTTTVGEITADELTPIIERELREHKWRDLVDTDELTWKIAAEIIMIQSESKELLDVTAVIQWFVRWQMLALVGSPESIVMLKKLLAIKETHFSDVQWENVVDDPSDDPRTRKQILHDEQAKETYDWRMELIVDLTKIGGFTHYYDFFDDIGISKKVSGTYFSNPWEINPSLYTLLVQFIKKKY